MGIRVTSGCEITARTLQAAYNDGLCLSTLDIENAFNTMPRIKIETAIIKYCPQLLKLFRLLYGHPSEIRHSNGQLLCMNHTGVRQGDPLSSLLFCLGLQDSLREIAKECDALAVGHGKHSFVMAIADDITIAGPTDLIQQMTTTAKEILRNNGLRLKETKCCILGKEYANSPEGLKILGTPIGTEAFIKEFLERQLQEWIRHIPKLRCLCPQSAYKILKYCINTPPEYTARCADWQQVEPY